ncbi:MAG TPA: hypothetical protein VG965_02300 [Patescibacteria group bacterium]|nr:hypothetical protein [Patescibacteria group bacterium]
MFSIQSHGSVKPSERPQSVVEPITTQPESPKSTIRSITSDELDEITKRAKMSPKERDFFMHAAGGATREFMLEIWQGRRISNTDVNNIAVKIRAKLKPLGVSIESTSRDGAVFGDVPMYQLRDQHASIYKLDDRKRTRGENILEKIPLWDAVDASAFDERVFPDLTDLKVTNRRVALSRINKRLKANGEIFVDISEADSDQPIYLHATAEYANKIPGMLRAEKKHQKNENLISKKSERKRTPKKNLQYVMYTNIARALETIDEVTPEQLDWMASITNPNYLSTNNSRAAIVRGVNPLLELAGFSLVKSKINKKDIYQKVTADEARRLAEEEKARLERWRSTHQQELAKWRAARNKTTQGSEVTMDIAEEYATPTIPQTSLTETVKIASAAWRDDTLDIRSIRSKRMQKRQTHTIESIAEAAGGS